MITHPENLSKERLKTELKNHGIRFNNNENKQYYVNLYHKRILGADESRHEFSSDEEFSQHVGRPERKQQSPKKKKTVKIDTYLAKVQGLVDEELREELEKFGRECGPITDSTRVVYQRKLAKLMTEFITKKSGGTPSSRHRESSEDEDEVMPQNESFVGEWSSEEDEEEDKIEDRGPAQRTPPVATGKRVRESSFRERFRRSPAKPVEDPPEPVRHRPKPYRKSTSSAGSSYYSFIVLLIMFVVAFFSYEHYSSHEADPSLITKGWKEVKCVWNWLKDYIVKTKLTPAPPTPTPNEAPPVDPPTPVTPPPEDPSAEPPTEEAATPTPTTEEPVPRATRN